MSRPDDPSYLNINPLSLLSISLIAFLVFLLAFGCGKTASSNALHIKAASTGDKDLAIKSGYTFAVTKTFTDINGKMTTASAYSVYLANYDLDPKNFALSIDKPLTADDYVRVVFTLIGDEGTNDKSPPKAGAYSAKADKFMKAESVCIAARKAGAEVKSWMDRTMITGQVKVTSVSTDEISGDVELGSGELAIKGSFTARVLKRASRP